MSAKGAGGETAAAKFMGMRLAAQRAGVSRRVLRNWIIAGRLRSFRPNAGGRVLVETAELDQLILEAERIPIKTGILDRPVTIFINGHAYPDKEQGDET